MSTPTVTPQSDPPQSTPQTQVIDINSNIETIRNAMMENGSQQKTVPEQPPVEQKEAAPTPTEQPPVTPPEPQPYQMYDLPDGRKHVKLETGEEFFGKNESEILAKIAKSKVDTTHWAKGLKDEISALKDRIPQAPPPPPVQKTEDQIAEENARNWMMEQVALGFGFKNAAEMQAALGKQQQITQQVAVEHATNAFLSRHPDFPNTTEAVESMFKVAEELQKRYNVEGADMQLLSDAHAIAISRGLYQPLSKEMQAASLAGKSNVAPPSQPPPVLPTQSSTSNPTEPNLWATNFTDLEKQYREELAKQRG